jgi:hypothetical protein
MMEGDWIAMLGVPLIAAGNPEAAAGEEVRTMCGSRTGGWSPPCVMSD